MRSDYDYLDIGTIWQSKAHGTLSLVLAIANLNLPKKYASMNPPSVTFTDGSRIFTSPVERFLELRYFVRKDEYIANKLLDVLSHPITEDEEDEQYDMDDSDDLLLAEDDDYSNSDESVAEPVIPVQAQTEAEHSEESKKEVITAQTITSTSASYPVQFVFETLDDPELENDLTNAAKALIRYDQFRTIDGVLYHHLAFAQNNNAVHTLISNVDKLKNCSIQYKDVIIPINLDLVTSAYTSAENIFDITGKFVDIKLVDNLIIADTTNLEDEDEDEDEEYTTESFAELVSNHDKPNSVDTASEITSNSESRADSETTSTIATEDVRESGESDNAESVSSGSNTFEELEEVSINADLENAEELDEDTSIPVEESSESEDNTEDDSAEEDHELLVNSLIMPEDEEDALGYDELQTEDDEIADSLASKLEALIEKSEDVIDAEATESDAQSESTEEQQPEEKTEEVEEAKEAKEVKTTEELSSEVVDEVLTAIQEEKTQEEKKEE